MKATHSEDLEFLREIRGRFPSSKSQRQGEWGLIIVFLLFGILCGLAAIFSIENKYHFGFGIFALMQFFAAIYIFLNRAVEYEFTSDEIIERRAGRIKNQIRIADIIDVRIVIRPYQVIIKTNNSNMKVQMIPSLNEAMLKEATEFNARKSESERQHLEEQSRQNISRFKRANLIGIIIFILIMFAFVCFAVWLKQRHYIP